MAGYSGILHVDFRDSQKSHNMGHIGWAMGIKVVRFLGLFSKFHVLFSKTLLDSRDSHKNHNGCEIKSSNFMICFPNQIPDGMALEVV